MTCSAGAPSKADIVWQKDLGTLSCPLGHCGLTVASVAPDATDSVWTISSLVLPGVDVYTDGTVFGTAIARYAANGAVGFTELGEFRTRLAGPAARTSGMFPGTGGHMFWLAPTRGAPGIELRDYAPGGEVSSSRRLVDVARRGNAVLRSDGSLVLAYEYSELGIASPDAGSGTAEGPRIDTDLARFDADGNVVWNQTASRSLGRGKADELEAAIATSLDVTFLTGTIEADVEPARAIVAKLDADGNVVWVRVMRDARIANPIALADGSVVMLLSRSDDVSAAPRLLKVGPDGAGEWNLLLDSVGFGVALTGVDETGRVWAESVALSGGADIHAFSGDGTRCATWSSFVENCEESGAQCAAVAFSPTRTGTAYFGTASSIGRVTFGGMP